MSSQSSILKSLYTNPTATSAPSPKESKSRGLFNIQVPNINALINSSSDFMSGIIGFAGNLWEKQKNKPEADTPQVVEESSGSIIFEQSPEILILNRHKVHGRKDRFSREYAINPKKLRVGRFSEHMPRQRLQLQIDEDVQPQITTLRESLISQQRKRTESCYPRLQHHKVSNQDLPVFTMGSADSIIEEKHCNVEVTHDVSENNFEEIHDKSIRDLSAIPKLRIPSDRYDDQLELQSYANSKPLENQGDSDRNRSLEEIRSEKEDITNPNASCMGEIHPEPLGQRVLPEDSIQSRSIESILVSIDGKIFKYFDKTQLCTIPVYTFWQFISRIRSLEVEIEGAWTRSSFSEGLCCIKVKKGNEKEDRSLEKIIALSLIDFEFNNELHLILLLGAFTSITGESDWPTKGSEWLEMGFTNEDLGEELKNGGLIGLLFTFYLSTHFSKFYKEMISVSRYYSFEVFQVCKQFASDTIEILRTRRLHKFFDENNKALDTTFLFYAGMIMHWFSVVVKNKDFDEIYLKVLGKAKNNPNEFILSAKKQFSEN